VKVCSVCGRPIVKGEKWTSVDGKIYHWECFKKGDPPSLVPLREVAGARSLAAARELAWSVFKAVRRGDWEKARRVAEDLKEILERLGLGRLGDILLKAVEAEKPRAVYKLLVRILYIIARMLGRRL